MKSIAWGILLFTIAFLAGAVWSIDIFEQNAKAGMITFGGTAYATAEIMPGRSE